MEGPIRVNFGENAYFYTALCAFFDWDDKTQFSLLDLIQEKEIKEVYLADSIDNPIYRDFLNTAKIPLHIPLQEHLISIYKDLKRSAKWQQDETVGLKYFIADHLSKQVSRLGTTRLLGDFLESQGIPVEAILYERSSEAFHSVSEVCEWARLFREFSYN